MDPPSYTVVVFDGKFWTHPRIVLLCLTETICLPCKSEVLTIQAMKAYGELDVPRISPAHLTSTLDDAVNFAPRPLSPRGRPYIRGRPGRLGDEKILLPLLVIEPRTLQPLDIK